jgi:DNA-binding response OmpR family regulator
MNRTKILLVDDDPNIRQLVGLYLTREGFEVQEAERGDEALKAFRASAPNLILLDIMLPGMDGWQVCREVRKVSNIPIIMLTAKDETFDKVLGRELGADDYIAKPFEPKELVARIKAVIRRYQSADAPDKELVFPGLTVNISHYTVSYRGREVEMPPRSWSFCIFSPAIPARCSRGSSCWSRYGATISSAIPERWTCTSSGCAKSWTARAWAGTSRPCGA